jgi:hypothetical protein
MPVNALQLGATQNLFAKHHNMVCHDVHCAAGLFLSSETSNRTCKDLPQISMGSAA